MHSRAALNTESSQTVATDGDGANAKVRKEAPRARGFVAGRKVDGSAFVRSTDAVASTRSFREMWVGSSWEGGKVRSPVASNNGASPSAPSPMWRTSFPP